MEQRSKNQRYSRHTAANYNIWKPEAWQFLHLYDNELKLLNNASFKLLIVQMGCNQI